jgi:hypothetical protein
LVEEPGLSRSSAASKGLQISMEHQILDLLGGKNYRPSNVPELLKQLRLPPNRQQDLQSALRSLEKSGPITRIKGNRYIKPREADLISGRIRMNRQ